MQNNATSKVTVAIKPLVYQGSLANAEGINQSVEGLVSSEGHLLAQLNLWRNALVLGGLFGTVFFFAYELSGDVIIYSIIPGLRGALLSTLTGILCSVALSAYVGQAFHLYERYQSDALRFFGTYVLPIVQQRREEAPRTEFDLWTALRLEVETMTREVKQSFHEMARSTQSIVNGLVLLEQKIENLPQVQLPPSFDSLNQTLIRFSSSAESLTSTIPALIEAVKSVGVYVPAKLLSGVESANSNLAMLTGIVQSAVDSMDSSRHEIAESSNMVISTARDISLSNESLGRATSDLVRVTGGIEQALYVSGNRIVDVERTASQTSEKVLESNQSLLNARKHLVQIRKKIVGIESSINEINNLKQVVGGLGGTIVKITGELQKLKTLSDQVEKATEKFTINSEAFSRRVHILDRLDAWLKRSQDAPLMRLIQSRLWRRFWTNGNSTPKAEMN